MSGVKITRVPCKHCRRETLHVVEFPEIGQTCVECKRIEPWAPISDHVKPVDRRKGTLGQAASARNARTQKLVKLTRDLTA